MNADHATQDLVKVLERSKRQAYMALSLSVLFVVIGIMALWGGGSIDYLAVAAIGCFAVAFVCFILFYIKYNYRAVKCPKCSARLVSDVLYKDGRHRMILRCAGCGYEYMTDVDLIP